MWKDTELEYNSCYKTEQSSLLQIWLKLAHLSLVLFLEHHDSPPLKQAIVAEWVDYCDSQTGDQGSYLIWNLSWYSIYYFYAKIHLFSVLL